jgi:hypothetical protein
MRSQKEITERIAMINMIITEDGDESAEFLSVEQQALRWCLEGKPRFGMEEIEKIVMDYAFSCNDKHPEKFVEMLAYLRMRLGVR